MANISKLIACYLNFDMAWFFYKLFHINAIVFKGSCGFLLCTVATHHIKLPGRLQPRLRRGGQRHRARPAALRQPAPAYAGGCVERGQQGRTRGDAGGARLLDAGCGTGALAVEAARRGAAVLAIDLSPTLVDIARERIPSDLAGRIDFRSGDMLDPALGSFDFVVGMDSLIHYRADDAVKVLAGLAPRTSTAMLFTFAPLTPPLAVMLAAGRLFPRGNRSPSIEPVTPSGLRRRIGVEPALASFSAARTERISAGFYTSQALELVRP